MRAFWAKAIASMIITKPTAVYRLEFPENGHGPYHAQCDTPLFKKLHRAHNYVDKHRPNLPGDISGRYLSGEISREEALFWRNNPTLSACTELEWLLLWFDGFWDDINRQGFKVYEIQVPRAFIGACGYQAFFFASEIISKIEVTM